MLKGEKVILRPMRPDDIARQHDFDQDLELYGLDSSAPQVASLERAQAFYESRTRFDAAAIAPFAIEADSEYIGYCTLMGLSNPHRNLELGIMIGDRAYWGRGYGRDAVRLLLDFAFRYLGARRIELTTNAKNERAYRCYRACGFVEESRPRKEVWVEGEYVDLIKMSILREEWQVQAAADDQPCHD